MTNLNPLTILDALLGDWASPRVRRALHSLIALAVLVYAAYEAAGQDWQKAGVSLLVAFYAAANKANTLSTPLDPAGHDSTPDDDLTYEQAGGQPFPETGAEGD